MCKMCLSERVILMKLSQVLKIYRENNDISQRELGRRCGLSNSLISLIEMGVNPQTGKAMSPDLETYRKLAYGMQMSLQQLFEQLGDDAMVNLSGDPQNSLDVGAAWYAAKIKQSGLDGYFDTYISQEERKILKAYKSADTGTKNAVKKLLDIE